MQVVKVGRMQTQLLPTTDKGSIFLEYLDQTTGHSMKSMIDEFPFIIGRNATCNLPVDSGRVSREHAEIVRHGTGYLIRDLHSTNGTSVNGEEIGEHVLVDGDTVSIADFEFDFHCPSAETARQTVTLAMEDRQRGDSAIAEDPQQLIQALRTFNQWVGFNRIDPMLSQIRSCGGHELVGHWCPLFHKAYQKQVPTQLLHDAPRLKTSLRMLQHVSALYALVEQEMSEGVLLLEVDQADLVCPDLLETVGWMRARLGRDVRVVLGGTVNLWEANLHDNLLLEDLRGMGVQLAALGIEQFKPPIVSEIFQHTTIVGVSASALAASLRSPAVANNIQEFIKEVSGSGCSLLAQVGPTGPEEEVLRQMGFHVHVRMLA